MSRSWALPIARNGKRSSSKTASALPRVSRCSTSSTRKNGSDFSELVISAKAEIQGGNAVAVAPGPPASRGGDDNQLLERSRIVDRECEMLGRLRCGGHQAHPVRRLEAVPRPLRNDHHHPALSA